jgi:hypothetical protein
MAFLTKEHYFKVRGINLEIELKNSATDNPSHAVEIFLQNVEDDVIMYMQQHFEVDINHLEPDVMAKVLTHQVDYLRANGDLSLDSENHTDYVLAPKAFTILKLYGYANVQTGRSAIHYGNKY